MRLFLFLFAALFTGSAGAAVGSITPSSAVVDITLCGHETSGTRSYRVTYNRTTIELCDTAGPEPCTPGTDADVASSGGRIAFQMTSLIPTGTYDVVMSCVDKPSPTADERVFSAVSQTVTTTALPSPSALTVTAVTSSVVSLSWTAASGTPTGYRVYANKEMVGTTSSTAFNHTGLTALSGRNYYVVAYNGDGNESSYTNIVQGVTCE